MEARKPLPAKITIWDDGSKYQGDNYVVVDFSKTTQHGDDVALVGTDAFGQRVRMKTRAWRCQEYKGKASEYWAKEFLRENGLSPRALERNWKTRRVPALLLDKMTDTDRRALKRQVGTDFDDEEILATNRLSALGNDSSIKILASDPDARTIKICKSGIPQAESLDLPVKVFKAYCFYELPPMPPKAQDDDGARRHRNLAPYACQKISRETLRRATPALAEYMGQNPARFSFGGNLYINFGLQQYGEAVGEQVFSNELQVFGMDRALFPFDESILKINEARPNPDDDQLHAAWAGEVTIAPDDSGTVPQAVILEMFNLIGDADSDSKPHYRAGADWQRTTQEEFFNDYRRGPVFFHSNKLFRHLIGLGVLGNDWK